MDGKGYRTKSTVSKEEIEQRINEFALGSRSGVGLPEEIKV